LLIQVDRRKRIITATLLFIKVVRDKIGSDLAED